MIRSVAVAAGRFWTDTDLPNQVEDLKTLLSGIVGKESVSNAGIVCEQHGRDEGPSMPSPADLVIWPKTTEEVSEVAKLLFAKNVAMIPFGTGTGLESGVCAVQGGVSIDLSKMDQITAFNPEDFDITVQPGITRQMLNHHLKDYGLWFPV
ncbi:hypothetical protein QYM36_002084, partial [Artemia franciscana]